MACILRRMEEEDKDDDKLGGQEKDEDTQQLKNNIPHSPVPLLNQFLWFSFVQALALAPARSRRI